jgi:hypothetical protein
LLVCSFAGFCCSFVCLCLFVRLAVVIRSVSFLVLFTSRLPQILRLA